jgi:D-alanyl-D-alanine carboxypeptidase/D-alanyl-D-alanine-endopeptidase (penicillin-binding protein 4)
MQNAKCKHYVVCSTGVNVATTFTPLSRTQVLFAFCIFNFAFLAAACGAKTPPAIITPPPVDNTRQLQTDLIAATKMPGVQRATWGIAVQSLARSERLFDLNPQILMVPASVAKLVSVATAVDAVGWDYRFTTTLRATGPIEGGALHGDLLVVGSGDPAIGGRGGDDFTAWIDALKGAGIHRIDGRIVGVDDSYEEPRPGFAWSWDDLGYSTGAIFGALNLAENRLTVTVAPGAVAGAPTSLAFNVDAQDLPITNRSITGAPGSMTLVWPEMRPGETMLTIAGSVPAGGMPATLTVSAGNPTAWFARMLRRRLIASGIEVAGPAVDGDDVSITSPDAAAILHTYRSHPLSEIAQPLLKESINLYGEAVQRLNASGPPPRTNDQALEGIKQRLVSWGVSADAFQLVDGSGLSRRDVLAPEALLTVLTRMYDPAGHSPWMTALPIAGIDGTLAARMKGTPGENTIRAKTGTMSNVRSLAGYATARSGEVLAFVAIVNNFEGTGAQANAALDAIAVRLASFSR